MDGRGFLLFVLTASQILTRSHCAGMIREFCPINATFKLSEEIRDSPETVLRKFPPESRWFQNGDIFGCSCYLKPCLPLCCPFGMKIKSRVCVKDDEEIFGNLPKIYSIDRTNDTNDEVNDQNFQVVISNPCGNGGYLLEPEKQPRHVFVLLKNGSIYSPDRKPAKLRNLDNYCLQPMENSTSYMPIICFLEDSDVVPETAVPEKRTEFAYIGMMISIPFLLITFIVYTILPGMRNIHGFTFRGYLGCLCVAYISMSVVQTVRSLPDGNHTVSCTFIAYTILLSFFASFFWLNVMSFDIWWTFGRPGLFQTGEKYSEKRRRLYYSIYAWGCAILFTSICAIMNQVTDVSDNVILPQFAKDNCWFKEDGGLAVYFYLPMGVTILCNIFFFIKTAAKLKRDGKDTKRFLEGTESRRSDNKRFHLSLKLFIVMGINWSMEIISWLCKDMDDRIWLITDLGNALQGAIIFIFFICKRSIFKLLSERFGCRQMPNFNPRNLLKSAPQNSNQDTCTTSVSQSQATPTP